MLFSACTISFSASTSLQDTRTAVRMSNFLRGLDLDRSCDAPEISILYLRVVNHQQGAVFIYILMCTGSFSEHVVKAGYAVFTARTTSSSTATTISYRIHEQRFDENVHYLSQEEGCRDCHTPFARSKGT